jgi:hypothetical protein
MQQAGRPGLLTAAGGGMSWLILRVFMLRAGGPGGVPAAGGGVGGGGAGAGRAHAGQPGGAVTDSRGVHVVSRRARRGSRCRRRRGWRRCWRWSRACWPTWRRPTRAPTWAGAARRRPGTPPSWSTPTPCSGGVAYPQRCAGCTAVPAERAASKCLPAAYLCAAVESLLRLLKGLPRHCVEKTGFTVCHGSMPAHTESHSHCAC